MRAICRRCAAPRAPARHLHSAPPNGPSAPKPGPRKPEPGAMSQKLQQATEDALLTGGNAGRRAVRDAGFSDALKEQLLDRIARSNVAALDAQPPATFSSAAATEQPWTGTEPTDAAVRRMLDDAHRPLRGTRTRTPGQRAAHARDKAAAYTDQRGSGSGLSDTERAELRADFSARFEPASPVPVPATLAGLAALADARIEAAMAGGQFRDLPDRGRPIGEDPLSRNPFVDRTEFLLNRIIQRQEVVPPWIEKQQELGRAVGGFRARLRAEWKRHAARMIAARGGPLEAQLQRAEAHARAEHYHQSGGGEGGVLFRDEAWEQAEHKYLMLAVDGLNALARSYNLMAPELAKKPYYTLERELARCFRDVAPLVAAEIRERAARPERPAREADAVPGPVRVYVREGKGYGLREWWKDVRQSWR